MLRIEIIMYNDHGDFDDTIALEFANTPNIREVVDSYIRSTLDVEGTHVVNVLSTDGTVLKTWCNV